MIRMIGKKYVLAEPRIGTSSIAPKICTNAEFLTPIIFRKLYEIGAETLAKLLDENKQIICIKGNEKRKVKGDLRP